MKFSRSDFEMQRSVSNASHMLLGDTLLTNTQARRASAENNAGFDGW
jgi:hypothetical protein